MKIGLSATGILRSLGFSALFTLLDSSAAHLNWQNGQAFRRASLPVLAPRAEGFSLIGSSESGLRFTNLLSEARALANANLMNGSGVALGDYDNDGLCDIYLCNLDGQNALFRNLGGFRFTNVTAEAGVAGPEQNGTGAVFADINGDGRLDLLVTSLGGPNSCFLNQGNGKFVDATAASGISSRLGATTMALADIDGNGTLDLYVANYGATSIIRSGGALNISYVNGKPVVRGRYAQRIQIVDNMMFELGEPDALYLNDGTGRFKPVSWTDGTFLDEDGKPLKEIFRDQGLTAMFYDINGDLAPDLYVCNDAFTPDRFWINDGKGRFRSLNRLAWRSTSHFSMGVDFADIDRDGHDDFFVVDMLSRLQKYIVTQKGNMPPQPRVPGDLLTQVQLRRNTLFQNRGDGTYAEIANLAGVAGTEWSWSGMFLDVDLDGWEDLLVSNGFPWNMDDMDSKQKVRSMGQLNVEQSRRTLLMFPPLHTRDMAFRNERNLTFKDMTTAWKFDSMQDSNGFAFADLDNDGDLDVVVNCLNGPALLYRNEASAPRLGVRLKGKVPNVQGIGAKITVEGGPVRQSQQVICGGRYVSGDDPMRVFACGTNSNPMRIEVRWRNGTVSVVENAQPNSIYEIDEAGARAAGLPEGKLPSPLFADASTNLNHRHHEIPFNDFEVQPSLPHKLSQSGPGATCFDLDADGWEDLIIGSGRGGKVSFLRNEKGARWTPLNINLPAPDDTSTILARHSSPGVTELIVALNTQETANTNRLTVYELRGTNLTRKAMLPTGSAIGPLALTELRETMTLFAGGRSLQRRYPEPASSHIYQLRDGTWSEDKNAASVFAKLGVVTSATWTDLSGDGTPELVVANDWGTLRIFDFSENEIKETTKEWGVDGWVGRWQSVSAADLNADGKMDLVAGNWGLNSLYNQAADGQVHLYYGDWNENGGIEMIEARVDGNKVVPWRDMQVLGTGLPWLPQKFSSHNAYANASMNEILGERVAKSREIRTTTLASAVFYNRGNPLERSDLPTEAQFTPVFGIAATDVNNDGFTDLVLAQNFFAVREEDGRLDAGRGLVLSGNREGNFAPLPARESGLAAYGEQRGLAVADFNNDGKRDVVLCQNAQETKLLVNQSSTNGILLRLVGTPRNPDAIGAKLQFDTGAIAEVRSGGGYWSQDTFMQIAPQGTRSVTVRWPGGKSTKHEIPTGARELHLKHDGSTESR